ncbi:MAG: class I SAM-dependent methyltransferase [Methylophaga sp.]|nr:class I SAM-dependent methyltransferase [Methylophaga sp.]
MIEHHQPPCSISFADEGCAASAAKLAAHLQLHLQPLDSAQLQLVVTPSQLELRLAAIGGPVFIDFTSGKLAHRRRFGGGRGQPLAKALGLKPGYQPHIADFTAGLGRDAFVMATLGCKVTLIEQNPLLYHLLDDALSRAAADPDTADIAAAMQLMHGDACELMPIEPLPEVVYLDPMYPARDKSALVKKDMQLLHQLVGPDHNGDRLLETARRYSAKRVVVKRPKNADYLANQKPAASVSSKNTRYDIYMPLTSG